MFSLVLFFAKWTANNSNKKDDMWWINPVPDRTQILRLYYKVGAGYHGYMYHRRTLSFSETLETTRQFQHGVDHGWWCMLEQHETFLKKQFNVWAFYGPAAGKIEKSRKRQRIRPILWDFFIATHWCTRSEFWDQIWMRLDILLWPSTK
jgi:hypothetical protein